MSLSSELISQFVKATKDETKKKSETTVYGTTVTVDGRTYVKLDGSELLTPVTTTADAKADERVTVLIKNHTATITGNVSSPAARSGDVSDASAKIEEAYTKITELDIAVANKVSTEQLDAVSARIDDLEAGNIDAGSLTAMKADIETLQADSLTVNEKLTAAEADIDDLEANKLDVSVANATYATVENLEATNADLYNLEATYGSFAKLTAADIDAVEASITKLQADKLNASDAEITYAKIADLDATNADVSNLEADVGDINTLIFGSATGDTIQTSFANAVVAQLGNAQIKSAMIDSVSADKITAGDIITNNVRVKSQNGLLLISDETIQISDETRVRVQIGKDASDDYSINVWDADGNLMFSKGGITDSAIKDAIIRNDMVSDTANIAAHKLDIDSLFEEINGSTNTIKSTQIYLDDEEQTLDVAFEALSTTVTEQGETISSQGTDISVIQGQISSKIWQQDIEAAASELQEETTTLSTQYSALEQEVDSISVTVASHTAQIADKADSSTVTTVSEKVSTLETDLSGFQSTVSETYATKTEVDDINVGGRNLLKNSRLITLYSNNTSTIPITCTLMTENGIDFYRFQRIYSEDYSRTILSLYSNILKSTFNYAEMTGKQVTLSFKARASQEISGTVMAYAYGTNTSTDFGFNGTFTLYSTEWKTHSITVDEFPDLTDLKGIRWNPYNIELTEDTIEDFYLDVRDYKFELGNKATDWTPAPEDVDTDIATAQAAAEAAQAAANQNAEDMATIVTDFNSDIQNLQTQIDGSITTWFYEVEPTSDSEPAVNWTTTDLKNVHLGDLYYDTITGYCYRWQVQNNAYSWQRITDTDVTKALSDAQNAQDTADQKRRVFYVEPTPPYDKGDLWVQGSDGDILRCQTVKVSGQSYNASDWIAASKYTDDTVATTANTNALAAQSAATNAQTSADAAQADIDALEIGGRNFIKNSSFATDSSKWTYTSVNTFEHISDGGYSGDGALQLTVATPSTVVPRQITSVTFPAGTALTCSVKIKEVEGEWTTDSYARWANLYSVRYSHHKALNDGWVLYVYKTILTEDLAPAAANVFGFAGMGNGTFLLDEIKLEKGSRETDWTAAPEDLESEVTSLETRVTKAETNITQNTEAIALTATKTEVATAKSEAISSANSNTATLLEDYSTTSEMEAAIQVSADSITSSVSSTYATKTALATTNSNVTAVQNTIDELEIGGRNLLLNSSFANGTSKWTCTYNTMSVVDGYSGDGLELVIATSTTVTPRQSLSMTLKAGDTLTGSVKAKVVEGDFSDYVMRFAGIITMPLVETKVIDDDWSLYIYRVTVTADTTIATGNSFGFAYGTVGTYIIDDLKLERGDKATDWTPAPEDMATEADLTDVENRVTSAESSITQNASSITSAVSRISTNENAISTLEQTADGLTLRLDTTDANVTAAAKTATNYINASTSGLVVGDHTGSTLGKNVLIDSDSVDIRNGTTTLASFGEDYVTLGRNAEESYIDLCDGAGRISANTAEAATSYPYRNAILIDSQEIETESTRFNALVTNAYGLDEAPELKKYAEVYLLRDSGSSHSTARIKSEHWNTTSGRYINAGFVGSTYDDSDSTYASMYVSDNFNSVYNSIKVYRSKTVMAQPVYIGGVEFTGSNKVLWSNSWYMNASQTATLSEAISDQVNGIVLVFSRYSDSTARNYHFNMHYVPKEAIADHGGCGFIFQMTTDGTFSVYASKYLYIHDTQIVGNDNNKASGTGACGITYNNAGFVLRYVYGV